MRCRCWDTNGGTWTERCLYWEEGHGYAMQVNADDYPYPFHSMRGTWRVDPTPAGTLVTMRFDYVPRYGPLGWPLDRFMIRPAFRRICSQLLDNWQNAMQRQAIESDASKLS